MYDGRRARKYCVRGLPALRLFCILLLSAAPIAAAPPTQAPAFVPTPDELETLAWKHIERNENARAAEAADKRLAEAPDDAAWRKKWIEIVFGAPGRRDEALAAARQLVGENRDDLDAKRLLAGLLAQAGGQEEATAIYDSLLEEHPDDVASLKARAEIARWNHDPLTAERLLLRAAEVAPADQQVSEGLERVQPDAAELRTVKTDPTVPLLVGLLVFPTALGFATRTVRPATWGVLVLWLATLLWGVSHVISPQ